MGEEARQEARRSSGDDGQGAGRQGEQPSRCPWAAGKAARAQARSSAADHCRCSEEGRVLQSDKVHSGGAGEVGEGEGIDTACTARVCSEADCIGDDKRSDCSANCSPNSNTLAHSLDSIPVDCQGLE